MILCADDYGLNAEVDGAILDLCRTGRLSAVSCMAALTRCSSPTLQALAEWSSSVDLGLHLCLADDALPAAEWQTVGGARSSFPAFTTNLRRSLLRQVSPSDGRRQAAAQYDLFVQKSGQRPAFVDGHLYAHQLAGYRQGLIDIVLSLPPELRPYVRNSWQPLRQLWRQRLPWLKALVIGSMGLKMLRLLVASGIRTNSGFAGIYSFGDWPRYPRLFPRFLASLRHPNGILVVHPGQKENWRLQEYVTLSNHAFSPGALNRYQPTNRS
jgi:chitin disaccharide deacetylase